MKVFHITRILHAFDGIDENTGKPIFRKVTIKEDCGLFATKEGALEQVQKDAKSPDGSLLHFYSVPGEDVYRVPFKDKLEWHYSIKERTIL